MESQGADPSLSEAQRTSLANETTPDLRQLMPEVVAGDETAIQTLHAITQAIIDKKLLRYAKTGADIDNIRGAVTEKMLGAHFDPNWPLPDNVPKEQEAQVVRARYGYYIGKTIRSVIADSIGQRGPVTSTENTAITTPLESSKSRYNNGDGTAAISDELLAEALTPDQLTIFYLRREGMEGSDISQRLGLSLQLTKKRMAQVVRQLEEHILHPGGLYRIEHATKDTDLNNAQVALSIKQGFIQGVKVLDRWYVKAEWLAEMYPRDDLLHLSKITDNATVLAFRRRYPERLIEQRRNIYIIKHDAALVQELAAQRQMRTPIAAPVPGYIALSDIPCTAKEVYRLRHAIYAGIYSNFIRHRRRLFVLETEARTYLAKIRSGENPNMS